MKFFKNKRIVVFSVIAIGITIVLVIIISNSLNFMKKTIDVTAENATGKSTQLRFNFEKLKQSGIIKD